MKACILGYNKALHSVKAAAQGVTQRVSFGDGGAF